MTQLLSFDKKICFGARTVIENVQRRFRKKNLNKSHETKQHYFIILKIRILMIGRLNCQQKQVISNHERNCSMYAAKEEKTKKKITNVRFYLVYLK